MAKPVADQITARGATETAGDAVAAKATRAKLLLVITELHMGGAARVMRDQAAAFSRFFDVEEVIFNRADEIDLRGDIEPTSLDVGGGGGPIQKLLNLRQRVARLRRIKRELRVDATISHLTGAHFVDVLSRGREKVILYVHGSLLHNELVRGPRRFIQNRLLIPLLYNRADRVVTVSRDIRPELISLGVRPEKLVTINNFFDHDQIAAKSREPLSPEESAIYDSAPVLVSAGRLHVQKNQAPLLDILAGVIRKRPAKLVLLGDGEERQPLADRARSLGLSVYDAADGAALIPAHDVYLLGAKANPFKYLPRSSLFLLSSGWEGFPLALCEAMICGVPVVSTDCATGPREILAPSTDSPVQPIREAESGDYGMLMPLLHHAPTRNAAITVWTDTLVGLLDDPDERLRSGELGRERMEDFTRKRIVKQWRELIEQVLAER